MRQMNCMSALAAILLASSSFAADKRMEDTGEMLIEKTSMAFTQIAKKAMPATVFIKAQLQMQPAQATPFDNPFQDEFFKRFFGQNPFNQPQNVEPQFASGSGFLIRDDGYVVTNNHVVKDAQLITVILNDGREYEATLKGSDPRTDLAVLKIEEKGLPFLTFGDSDEVEIGESVVAIGNPFGLNASLSVGVVSAKGRQDLGIASYEDFIQTDAAINPGNSGGPLLNVRCEVIGVNTAIFTRSGGYQGIGFSIPSKMVNNVIDQILDGGTVKRAFLGIVLQPVDKELTDALSLGKQEGVLISEIVKDSPAQKAGLQQGDIIISYNDKPAKTVAKFRNDIAMMNPGSDLSLKLLRNGKTLNLAVKLGSQSESEAISTEVISKIGLELDALTSEVASKLGYSSELQGVVITKVKPGSSAANVGLRPGFLITGVAANLSNPIPVKNLADFEEALKTLGDRKHVILIVRQQNYQRYYTLKLN